MTITANDLMNIPAHALFVIWDNNDGTDGDAKFLNNSVGRAACANLYNRLNGPYKKVVYETDTGDVDLFVHINS